MPRKGKQTTLSRYSATKHRTRASISDLHDLNLGAKDALPKGHSGKSHHSGNASGTIHTQVNANSAAESSSSSLSADEGKGGGTSGSDTSGDDEEHSNDDDDDAEAIAPSGRSLGRNGRQAGLIDCVTAGMKRRRSPHSSEEEQLFRKGVRPVKTAAALGRAQNLLGDSDDEEYAAVDFISDSDEEEPSVEELEEKMIIASEGNETDEKTPGPSAPPSVSSLEWEGFDLDDDIFLADVPFFDDEIGRTEPNVSGTETDVYNIDALYTREPLPSPTPRRVRFVDAEQHHSSRSSTRTSDAEDDAFPELFLQQDSLDPHFRSMIENDTDAGDGNIVSDGEGSCWDFDERENFELEKHGLDESSGSSCGSSSGYETDEGETTDEEVMPPSTVNRPQTRLRRRASTSSFAAEESVPSTPIRKPTTIPASRRYGPSMGSWIADPTKPIAVIDSTGKHMVIIPAQRPTKADKLFSQVSTSGSSTANNSPRNSFAGPAGGLDESDNDRSDFSSQEFMGSMYGSGANVMMPGLLHGAPGSGHLLGGQVMGPPEAFYPFKTIGPNGQILEDADEDDDDDDDENLWNVHDFIDFGDGSSDDDKQDGEDSEVRPPPATPAATDSNSAAGCAHNLLEHFDRGVVTAFRRNQHRHHALLRRPIPSSSLRGGGAIKGGRHIAANSPISPLRKRKPSDSFNRMGSPLVGVTAKRRVVNTRRRSSST